MYVSVLQKEKSPFFAEPFFKAVLFWIVQAVGLIKGHDLKIGVQRANYLNTISILTLNNDRKCPPLFRRPRLSTNLRHIILPHISFVVGVFIKTHLLVLTLANVYIFVNGKTEKFLLNAFLNGSTSFIRT